MTRTVEDMTSVDHACAVPVSDEQLWEMTAAFVAGGEQVLYFDDGTAIDGALEQGFPAVRFTGQLSYALQRAGGVSLREYDDAIDEVIHHRPARVLCFYDRRRFPDEAIDELRAQHHTEVAVPAIYDDNLLRITSGRTGFARLAGEIDHSNRPRIRRLLDTTLDQALRSHSAPSDITLDMSSLRFLDVAGAVSLVHAAEEFPSTHRLVLLGVRPRVARVLDRCGAPFAAQLELRQQDDRSGEAEAE